MDQDTVVSLATQAMWIALLVAGPLLIVGLVVGLVVSLFQAVTQVQEQSLTFIPKILATVVVIIVLGPWMLGKLVDYTTELYRTIPQLIGL